MRWQELMVEVACVYVGPTHYQFRWISSDPLWRGRGAKIYFLFWKTVVAMGLLVTTMQISCNECLTLAHPVRTRNEQEPKALAQNWANRMVRFHWLRQQLGAPSSPVRASFSRPSDVWPGGRTRSTTTLEVDVRLQPANQIKEKNEKNRKLGQKYEKCKFD
jgi:hypothetical protein